MDSLPKSAYVPPHMRKRAAAPAVATNTDAEPAPAAINDTSTASLKSGTAHSEKAQSTPNRASNGSCQTPSPLTTRELPCQSTKAECDAAEKAHSPVSTHVGGDVAYTMPKDLAWDTPKPNPPPIATSKENPQWPRTRGTRQKIIWPKQSEMRARSSDSSVDGGVVCKSDSDGDPDYDVKKLMDWNGDWMPPPEQWTGRKGHVNRHLGRSVEEWIESHPKDIFGDHLKFSESPTFCEAGEIVPTFWVVTHIEQGSLGEFWKSMPTRDPRALSDVSERSPFWERYNEDDDCIIDPLKVPDARVDPEDLNNHRAGQDLLASGEDNLTALNKWKQRKAYRTQKRQNRPVPVTVPTGPPPPDRRIVPKANVYFRPFQPRDVEGIGAIYNHYVEETIHANEFDARTAEQIGNRINTVVQEGLPFLVAIAKGNHSRVPTSYVEEKVVGFASLDDYCDRSSLYRYSFELNLFVHPGYTSQNIASCLLDALLEMSNTGYNACGGYEYRNESEYLKMGPKRVIKTITLTIYKEHGASADSASDFLKRFNFSRCGHISKAGYKYGKVVDAHLYQHTTSENIDPNSRPSLPL
ncbi:hypothetical protein DE146DRAFT_689724 [Phaeosphaeria sp. MPI-PUGE-AT-0046c]|nr:hypothetical protein DE146DRAFT_689724 [Phaeosphaeria sp. MPI-PUGE-AT-0046c]